MSDDSKQIGLRLSLEQYNYLSSLAAKHEIDIPKMVRFLLFDVFAKGKFMDELLERTDYAENKLCDKIEEQLAEYDELKRHNQAIINILSDLGWRLCRTEDRAAYVENLKDIIREKQLQ